MTPCRFLLSLVLSASAAAAGAVDPYQSRQDRSYQSLAGSIQRAFAVPGSSTPNAPYRSNLLSSSGSSSGSYSGGRSSSHGNNSGSISGGNSDSASWALPMRQPAFTWGAGRALTPPDADSQKIALARNAVWQLPKPPSAGLKEISAYYVGQGVSFDRAQRAAQNDLDAYELALARRQSDAAWQAHDAKHKAAQAFVQGQRAGNAQFNADLDAAKQRAQASNSTEDARAWWAVYSRPHTREVYLNVNLATKSDAALFAAQRGVAEAYADAWVRFARADPAGHEWRDKAALVGNIEASKEAYKIYAETQPTQMGAAASLFEKAFETQSHQGGVAQSDPKHNDLGRLLAAGYLARLYARGDSSLPADLPRAMEWLKKLPLATPAPWTEWSNLIRQDLVAEVLMANPMAARERQDEILAYWEDLDRQVMEDRSLQVRTTAFTLYGLYAGQYRAMPKAINPAKADALWAWMNPKGQDNQLRRVLTARDWRRAGLFDGVTPEQLTDAGLAQRLGHLWMQRTDGRADARKAVAFYERGFVLADQGSPVPLANAYLAAGEPDKAVQTLKRRVSREDERWAVSLRQAQMHYRGEAGPIAMAEADQIMKTLKAGLKSPWRREEVAFAQELHFESIIGPVLARHSLINTSPLPSTPEARQARAGQTRANFEAALPALRELAFDGHTQALRLWAVATLAGDVSTTPEDAAAAKATLFMDAQGGDATALSILAQRLYLDAQAERGELPAAKVASKAELQARFSEAADWLEASVKSGDNSARWPLATLYSEGLGRSLSLPKAREQLAPLAAAGDAEAQAAMAQWAVLVPAAKRESAKR